MLGAFLAELVRELDGACEAAFRDSLALAVRAVGEAPAAGLAPVIAGLHVDVRESGFEILVTGGALGDVARDAALRANAARSVLRCWRSVQESECDDAERFDELWTRIVEDLPPLPDAALAALPNLAREVRDAVANPLRLWPLEASGHTDEELFGHGLDAQHQTHTSRNTLPDAPTHLDRPALVHTDATSGLEALCQWRVEREAWSRVLTRLAPWLPVQPRG